MHRAILSKRMILMTLVFVALYSGAVFVFATPPGSPYTPAETLDPGCAPGATNCSVDIGSGGATPTNGLQTISGSLGLGGTLTETNTYIDGDGVGTHNVAFGGVTPISSFFVDTASGAGGADIDFNSVYGSWVVENGISFRSTSSGSTELFTFKNNTDYLFSMAKGGFVFFDNNYTYTASEESKFFFDKDNKVIRLGSVEGTQWEGASAGARSIAIGFVGPTGPYNAPIASGINSLSLGGGTASGNFAMSFGYGGTASGVGAGVFGAGTASGDGSLAFGSSSLASGIASFATYGSTASGFDSFAVGGATASGSRSVAIGSGSLASGSSAVALGDDNHATGDESTAFGFSSTASGLAAISFGTQTLASGDHATVFGDTMFARSFRETAFGSFNTDYTPADPLAWDATDRLLVIGNGESTGVESDALTILKNGKTGIGYDNFETTALAALLQVNGSLQQTGATSCALVADADGTVACAPSDARLKTGIQNLNYGLATVMQLRPVSYEFINKKYGDGNQIGFIAQELEAIIPEVVTEGPNYKSVNYGLVTSVLVNAVQELNLKISDIESFSTVTNTTFKDRLIAWLADKANGIEKIFAKEVNVETLCIHDVDGNKTCLDKAQVDALIHGGVAVPVIPVVPIDAGVPAESPDPVIETPIPDAPSDVPPADVPAPIDPIEPIVPAEPVL